MLPGILPVVEIPGYDNGADSKGNQNIEGRGDALISAVRPAKNLGDEESTIGSDGCGEARYQGGMEGIVKDIGNHAEGGTVDKAGGEEEQQERGEEHDKVVGLDA